MEPNSAVLPKPKFPNMLLRTFILSISCGILCISQLFSICYCPSAWLDEHPDLPGVQGVLSTKRSHLNATIPVADGTFNGFDIFYVGAPPISTVHCVGENFIEDKSWLFRSCEYTTLCFDIDRRDITLYRQKAVPLPEHYWSSTQMHRNNTHVAGGSQPKTWFPILAQDKFGMKTRIGRFRPRSGKVPSSYYRFDATMLPFYRHPTSYRNPGHLIWDDFMALYTLLDIFDRVDDRLFLAQMRRPTTNEFEESVPSSDIIKRFLSLMGKHPYNIDISQGYDLKLDNPKFASDGSDRVICADHGLSGSGLFSDHGDRRWHGQWEADRELPHNIGRGGLFRRYRRFLMKNQGISPDRKMDVHPYKVIVSISSSTKQDRANVTFDEEIDRLSALGDRVDISVVNMTSLTLEEQIEVVSTAAVYVSVVGGGTSSAIFLPKGAHLILFYNPVRFLDWDFWNNFPQVKVHWMPLWSNIEGGVLKSDTNGTLLNLIDRELALLDSFA